MVGRNDAMEQMSAASPRARKRRSPQRHLGGVALALAAAVTSAACSGGFQARDLAGAETAPEVAGADVQAAPGSVPTADPTVTPMDPPVAVAPACDETAPSLSSLQKGTTRLTGTTPVQLPVMAVAPDRAVLLFTARAGGAHVEDVAVRGRLASDAAVEFTRPVDLADPTPVDVEWSVFEFACGVRVQRGDLTVGAAELRAPLAAPVPSDRAFVLWSSTAPATGEPGVRDGMPSVALVDDAAASGALGQVEVVSARPAGQQVSWQVVEFLGATGGRTQTVRAAFDPSATTASVTLPVAVDPSRSFVLVGPVSGPATGRLDGPSTVSVDRSAAAVGSGGEAVVQVVELSGAVVANATVALGAGSASAVVDVVGFDPAHSVAFSAGQGAAGQSGGVAVDGDERASTAVVTTSVTEGQLLVRRGDGDGVARADVSVVTWG